jgi:hypothetical protein
MGERVGEKAESRSQEPESRSQKPRGRRKREMKRPPAKEFQDSIVKIVASLSRILSFSF